MSKILLIEDRTERQQRFITETNINLNDDVYTSILDNKIGDNYLNLFEQLKNDTFNFDNYSIIISHKSAFEGENSIILSKLETYCKKNKKVLVLFSGGIDANYYLKDDEYEHIELNSRTLYSENIKLFLEDFKDANLNPLILCYGDRWKLNILLNILEKLTLFIAKMTNKPVLYSAFLRDNPDIMIIDTLNLDIYSPVIESRKITKDEILKLKDSMLNYIDESMKYE